MALSPVLNNNESDTLENEIRKFLTKQGFVCNQKSDFDSSIDIVAIKNGDYFLIEVKSITKDKRIRIDEINENAEIVLSSTPNGYLIPFKVNNCSRSKLIKFMCYLK